MESELKNGKFIEMLPEGAIEYTQRKATERLASSLKGPRYYKSENGHVFLELIDGFVEYTSQEWEEEVRVNEAAVKQLQDDRQCLKKWFPNKDFTVGVYRDRLYEANTKEICQLIENEIILPITASQDKFEEGWPLVKFMLQQTIDELEQSRQAPSVPDKQAKKVMKHRKLSYDNLIKRYDSMLELMKSKRSKTLSHAQICLIEIYNKRPITKTNKEIVALNYKIESSNGGRVLLGKYNEMDDEGLRLLRRDIENDIEKVKPWLIGDALEMAERELKKVRNNR